MPKNKQTRGTKYWGGHTMNQHSYGNITNKRLGKNTKPTDMEETNAHAGLFSHTTPVERTSENDGHLNPARIRHANTKMWHAIKRGEA